MHGELLEVLAGRDGQLGPGVEDVAHGGGGTALESGFDGPGEPGPVVARENGVDARRVPVLGVEEEAVHVEEAGSHGREAGGKLGTRSFMILLGYLWMRNWGIAV